MHLIVILFIFRGGGGGSGWALIRGWELKKYSSGWGGGRLLEVGRLLTFSTFRVGAYSRWALIQGWALKRINTVSTIGIY